MDMRILYSSSKMLSENKTGNCDMKYCFICNSYYIIDAPLSVGHVCLYIISLCSVYSQIFQ